VKEQLTRLELDLSDYEPTQEKGDGVISKRKSRELQEGKLEDRVEWDAMEIGDDLPTPPSDESDSVDPDRPKFEYDAEKPPPINPLTGKLIIRGTTWPIGDQQTDLFLEAYFRGGDQKGWLISERFRGNETQEIVTKGHLRAGGTWYWINLSDWQTHPTQAPGKFAIIIGNRRITYEGPQPETREEAANAFWEKTGLSPLTWRIRWTPKGLSGRLLRKEEDESLFASASALSKTPRLLPQIVRSPIKKSFPPYFEKLTGYSIKKVKLWFDGHYINPSDVPKNVDVGIEYTSRSKEPIRTLTIIWPEGIENWLVKADDLAEEITKITTEKGLSWENGYIGAETGRAITQWPHGGVAKWFTRSKGKSSRKGPSIPDPPMESEETSEDLPKETPIRRARKTVRNRDITCNGQPFTEDEARRWLKKNETWKITRNGKTWDGEKIKMGDTFEFEDGRKTEREVQCIDPQGQTTLLSVNPVWDWTSSHLEWRFLKNGKKWNKRSLNSGNRLEAQLRAVFASAAALHPSDQNGTSAPDPPGAHTGQGKTTPKGLPLVAPAPYTCGRDPIESFNEKEMKAWLEENVRWKIARNDEIWNYQDMEPGDHFELWEGKKEERDVICKDLTTTVTVKKEEARIWLFNHVRMNIKRNNMPWDGTTVEPGDKFEALGKLNGGAGPKKYRDPFSVKNFNARMACRKRVEAAARELREKLHAEEALEESVRQRSTSVIYEGQEFITRVFVDEDWDKLTARRFSRWVRSFSRLERPWQNLIDEQTGK
jgi:hypothetical protein